MQKLKIGYDYAREKDDQQQAERKIKTYSSISSFFYKYDLVAPRENTFKDSFVDEFKIQFEEQHGKTFPKFLSVDQMLKVSEIDISNLIALNEEWHTNRAPVDIESKRFGVQSIDYTIYAENEIEVERYNIAIEQIQLIERLDKLGHKVNLPRFIQDLRGLLMIDHRTSKVVPNVTFIKKK